MKNRFKVVFAAALFIQVVSLQAFNQMDTEPVNPSRKSDTTETSDSSTFDPQNPKAAIINTSGCIECMAYEVGETFVLDGVEYLVSR